MSDRETTPQSDSGWGRPGARRGTRRRSLALALGIYLGVSLGYFLFAAPETLLQHTHSNHFALLAESWIDGRLDLGGPPPDYTGLNDFARHEGRWYVAFPPFPAVLLLPVVAWAGNAERVRDGQFFVWLAGIAPALLFLVLEALRRAGRSRRACSHNAALAGAFAFGTVYFFSSVQGTVWYAAHVVGTALLLLYVLAALDARSPTLAGIALGLAFLTRAPLLGAFPLFVAEALRVSAAPRSGPAPRTLIRALVELGERCRYGALLRRLTLFSVPVVIATVLAGAHNHLRFGSFTEPGYQYLQIAWQDRIQTWGLFHWHYLARNLGVMLTSLPYPPRPGSDDWFQINGHGLALWVTTPAFLWLLWPRTKGLLHLACWVSVAMIALPTLLYQNTGWVQFGWRFSNDYAALLLVLLAVGGRRFSIPFWVAVAVGVLVNAFGAATFNRAAASHFYFVEPTQRILYQPD